MNQRKTFVWAAVGLAALSVAVGGFTAKPLFAQIRAALVQNRDEPARQPFTLQVTNGLPAATWQVPPGKRYVIEQYSMRCSVDSANGGALGDVSVSVGNLIEAHAFAPHSIDLNGAGQILWVASATTRLYADPADLITLRGSVNFNASGAVPHGCLGSVSGYAIDLP